MIKHCPTEEMLANFCTKPLQGSLFIGLYSYIMGVEYNYNDGRKQSKSQFHCHPTDCISLSGDFM